MGVSSKTAPISRISLCNYFRVESYQGRSCATAKSLIGDRTFYLQKIEPLKGFTSPEQLAGQNLMGAEVVGVFGDHVAAQVFDNQQLCSKFVETFNNAHIQNTENRFRVMTQLVSKQGLQYFTEVENNSPIIIWDEKGAETSLKPYQLKLFLIDKNNPDIENIKLTNGASRGLTRLRAVLDFFDLERFYTLTNLKFDEIFTDFVWSRWDLLNKTEMGFPLLCMAQKILAEEKIDGVMKLPQEHRDMIGESNRPLFAQFNNACKEYYCYTDAEKDERTWLFFGHISSRMSDAGTEMGFLFEPGKNGSYYPSILHVIYHMIRSLENPEMLKILCTWIQFYENIRIARPQLRLPLKNSYLSELRPEIESLPSDIRNGADKLIKELLINAKYSMRDSRGMPVFEEREINSLFNLH